MDAILRILCYTFRNPRQAPDFLLLQLYVAVEHPELELLQKRKLVEVHFCCKKARFERRCSSSAPTLPIKVIGTFGKESSVLRNVVADSTDLINIVCPCQSIVPSWKQTANCREELSPLLFGKLCVEGVNGDIDSSAIGLEREYPMHDLGRRVSERRAKVVEIFQVCLVQGISDDFDVKIVKVLSRYAIAEVGSCEDENGINQLTQIRMDFETNPVVSPREHSGTTLQCSLRRRARAWCQTLQADDIAPAARGYLFREVFQ